MSFHKQFSVSQNTKMEKPSCSKVGFEMTEKHSYSSIEALEKLLDNGEDKEETIELSDIGDSEVEEG